MTVRRAWLWIAGAVVADGILRLRFLNVPLSVDEAGYGQVTRLWARGFALYGDVAWVDRPQGLLGLYRLALMFGDEWAIRMLALKAGIAIVLALAVTGASRSPQAPEIPTLAEFLPGFEITSWGGVMGPGGMAPAVVNKIHADTVRALRLPDIQERLGGLGATVLAQGPAEFAVFLQAEIKKWDGVAKRANIKIE